MIPSHISDWGSPDGKLEWGIQGEELNKLRKSASFGIRSNGSSTGAIKDSQTMKPTQLGFNEQQQKPQHLDPSGSEAIPSWLEQLYMEQEQIVA
ncbi:hypothetical protein Nepgr_000188 [Nepenthes gracilis]|uniref:Uncharacterized protein n=1 Tax=Nepenthes gracilis TaxID=150966 RepID=A0AAD3P2N6_NEPGR|nr:hypothetical protein Nepgr_000188 [Nepenthes gracilis]